ncbi:hypothetical protein HD806DRAFT_457509 [Xylariaceae sp. AK1471]|nr:hypothetical protein HD806DRAFT_457509 [Xylariaceae sp. AK1471]
MHNEYDPRGLFISEEDYRLWQSAQDDLQVVGLLKAKVLRICMAENESAAAPGNESSSTAAENRPSSAAPEDKSPPSDSKNKSSPAAPGEFPKTSGLSSVELRVLGKKARKVTRILKKQKKLVEKARAQLEKDIENQQGTSDKWDERKLELDVREFTIKFEMETIWKMPNNILETESMKRIVKEWKTGAGELWNAFRTGEPPPMDDDMTTEAGDDLLLRNSETFA